jgi:phage terminase small subunit
MAPKTIEAPATSSVTSQNPPSPTTIPSNIAQRIANSGLKTNHQIFLNEYLVCRNAAESARKAGYQGKRLNVAGYKLLQKPEIKELVEAFDKEKLSVSEAKVAQVIERDITRETYLTTVQNAYDEVGPKHSNAPAYLTIIAKVKGFFVEVMQNNFMVNVNAPEFESSVTSSASSLARRIERINKANQAKSKDA